MMAYYQRHAHAAASGLLDFWAAIASNRRQQLMYEKFT